jgi:hypothetical protein
MNALLNNSLIGFGNNIVPGLRTDVPMDMGQYVNYLTPSFQVAGNVSAFQNAFDSVPVGNFNNSIFNSFPSAQYPSAYSDLNKSSKANNEASIVDANGQLIPLTDKQIEKARKSNNGEYKVTDTHKEIAKQYIDAAKEILKRDPSTISTGDVETIKGIFEEVNKNPMLADAFIQKANSEKFSAPNGKTSTILGAYEQALTNTQGQKAAKDEMANVKKEFKENVSDRNSEAYSKFEDQYSNDSSNVEYSLKAKAMNNPGKVLGYGIAGLAAARVGYKYLGGKQVLKGAGTLLGKIGGKTLSSGKVLGKLGKWGMIAALAYGTYKLCTSETK